MQTKHLNNKDYAYTIDVPISSNGAGRITAGERLRYGF